MNVWKIVAAIADLDPPCQEPKLEFKPRIRIDAGTATNSRDAVCSSQESSLAFQVLGIVLIAVKMGSDSKNKYSVILPTYNERQNLPVLVQMLYDVFTKE
jgi:hypothetical protein